MAELLSINGTLESTDDLSGNLNITGTTNLAALTASTTTINGNLTVTGTTSLGSITSTGSTVNGNLTVTGTTSVRALTSTASTVNGNLTVTGTTSLGTLTASTTTVNGTLRVTGTTNTGALTASTLNLTTIGSGTSITNLGITSGGTIVTGSTMITPLYLSVNTGTPQSIPWNIETTVSGWTGTYVNNTPSAWNATTGVWTCPRAGLYDMSFSAMLDYVAPTDLNLREFAPILNHTFIGGGSTIYIGNYWALTTASTRTPMTTIRLVVFVNQGDTIRPRIFQNLRDNTAVGIITGRNSLIITELPNSIAR